MQRTVVGRFDAVINVGASHAHGGFPTALRGSEGTRARRDLWRGVLAQASVRRISSRPWGGATVDELSDLDGLRAAVRDAGFAIVHESLCDRT